jgi:methylthioribose-1-phosphate isomerase
MLETIVWTGSTVRLVDQTRLPCETVYVDIHDERQMWDAIKRLVVRGAPAIGVAAAFGLYLGMRNVNVDARDVTGFFDRVDEVGAYLKSSRPTAVNLAWAVDRVTRIAQAGRKQHSELPGIKQRMLDEAIAMLEEDREACRAIGAHGLLLLRDLSPAGEVVHVLTHCNAGSLATVAYGTALAPIYVGAEQGIRFHVFADETRPLLQGSRLTAYELRENGIPVTVLCDNMAATVMQQGKIKAVIVGTDRVAANGDVANKIGTLSVAILARHFRIPFYVAAPISSIDLSLSSGSEIPIEQREPWEITRGMGRVTAPEGVDVYNPAFDVTPHELVTAIITEKGIVTAPYIVGLRSVAQGV